MRDCGVLKCICINWTQRKTSDQKVKKIVKMKNHALNQRGRNQDLSEIRASDDGKNAQEKARARARHDMARQGEVWENKIRQGVHASQA